MHVRQGICVANVTLLSLKCRATAVISSYFASTLYMFDAYSNTSARELVDDRCIIGMSWCWTLFGTRWKEEQSEGLDDIARSPVSPAPSAQSVTMTITNGHSTLQ